MKNNFLLYAAALWLPDGSGTVAPEALADAKTKYGVRRTDHFAQSVLATAGDALAHAAPDILNGAETALFLTSALGPQKMICSFQNDLLDFPPENALPNSFSHSVNNAVTSAVAAAFGITGPAYSLTGFADGPSGALLSAEALLDTGCVRMAMIIFAEENAMLSEAMRAIGLPVPAEHVAVLLVGPAKKTASSHAMPFDFSPDMDYVELVRTFRKELPNL